MLKTNLNGNGVPKASLFERQPLLAFVVGVVVAIMATSLVREDVISTAETLFNYFPIKFNVTPATDYTGALALGIFTTLVQAIAMGIIPMKNVSMGARVTALVAFLIFLPIDNWTDIVHRSEYLTGNIWVASATTVIFYTFGSEVAAGLGWYTAAKFFRPAISQLMLYSASFLAFVGVIKREWKNYMRVAKARAKRYVDSRQDGNMVGEAGSNGNASTRKTSTRRKSTPKSRNKFSSSQGRPYGR